MPDDVDDGRFRVIATSTRYRGRILNLRLDTVTMPGGASVTREVVEHLPAVAIVAVDDAGRVVLLDQYRHPLRRRLWEIPAGLCDVPGEDPLAAARRELAEETGLAADDWRLLIDLASSPGFCTESVRVFLARGLRDVASASRRDEELDLAVVRVPLEQAVAAVLAGRIVNSIAVAGLLAARQALRDGAELRAAATAPASNALVGPSGEIPAAPVLE